MGLLGEQTSGAGDNPNWRAQLSHNEKSRCERNICKHKHERAVAHMFFLLGLSLTNPHHVLIVAHLAEITPQAGGTLDPCRCRAPCHPKAQRVREGGMEGEVKSFSVLSKFVVSKPGGKGYRMVADFRVVNARCLMNSFPMPLLEHLVGCMKGSVIFGSLDNIRNSW